MDQLNFPKDRTQLVPPGTGPLQTGDTYTVNSTTWVYSDDAGAWGAGGSTSIADDIYLSKVTDDTALGEITFGVKQSGYPKAVLNREYNSPTLYGAKWANFMYGGANDASLYLLTGTQNTNNWKNISTFGVYSSSSGVTINGHLQNRANGKGLKIFLEDGVSDGLEITPRSTSGANRAVAVTFNKRTGSEEEAAGTIETRGNPGDTNIIIKSANGSSPVTASITDTRNVLSSTPLTSAVAAVKALNPSVITLNTGAVVTSFPIDTTKLNANFAVIGEEDAVDENGNDDLAGVDHGRLVPLLTKALQEALDKIETLETRLSDAGIA